MKNVIHSEMLTNWAVQSHHVVIQFFNLYEPHDTVVVLLYAVLQPIIQKFKNHGSFANENFLCWNCLLEELPQFYIFKTTHSVDFFRHLEIQQGTPPKTPRKRKLQGSSDRITKLIFLLFEDDCSLLSLTPLTVMPQIFNVSISKYLRYFLIWLFSPSDFIGGHNFWCDLWMIITLIRLLCVHYIHVLNWHSSKIT